MSAGEPSFYVLGSGRVGATLATILDAEGRLAGCWTRSANSAQQLSAWLSIEVASGALTRISDEGAVIVVAVPDRIVSRVLFAHPERTEPTRRWLHVSGSLGQAVYHDADVVGAAGVAHPLHSFSAAVTPAAELAGAVMALSGDAAAVEAGSSLAAALRCEVVEIPEGREVAYHLAATLSSNGVYALLHAVDSVLSDAGIRDERLLAGMSRLASQSAESARKDGVVAAATGPAVRGDANTVLAHRRWLGEHRSEVAPLYDELSRALVDIAEERNLSPQLIAALSAVLVER